MKCEEYLQQIMKNFEQHGDRKIYDNDLEALCYCEDYDEYIKSLQKKNQI